MAKEWGSTCGSHFGYLRDRWGPELDRIFIASFKSLLGPRFGVQIWAQKWDRFEPKNAVNHRTIWLLPAYVLQADLRCTSMSMNVNICFFSPARSKLLLEQSRSLDGRPVFTTFLGLFWGS